MSQKTESSGNKVLQKLRLEKPALVVLNKITSRYQYPYLKGVEARGKILFNIISPHLEGDDSFLDIMCGYAPLARPLLKSGYQITGFDDNRNAIKDLRKLYPNGEWVRASFNKFEPEASDKSFSVFLLLGAFELCSQPQFVTSISNLLDRFKPRVFFLETNRSIEKAPTINEPFLDEAATNRSPHLKGYNAMLKTLLDHGFEVTDVGQYDAQLKEQWATIRIYAILKASH